MYRNYRFLEQIYCKFDKTNLMIFQSKPNCPKAGTDQNIFRISNELPIGMKSLKKKDNNNNNNNNAIAKLDANNENSHSMHTVPGYSA